MTKQGADISAVKRNNKKLILQTVFENGVISRTEISKMLTISKPAVNEHIDQLLGIGVIREIGEGVSAKKGGRRPILIEINPEYKINIALDFNFTKPQLALGTITGTPIDRIRLQMSGSVEMFCAELKSAVDGLLSKHGIGLEKIGLIVISTPGIINEAKCEIHVNSQFKSRNMFIVKQFLEDTYNIKVRLKNDVNMAALAEWIFLKKDLLFVSCGLGVGSAVVLDGRLYEGATYAAGEIGYFMDAASGELLEESICIDTILKRLGYESFDDVVKAYEAGDKAVLEEAGRIGRLLGIAINNVISVCDIQTVVLGGDYLVFTEIIFQEIENIMMQSKLPKKPEISATTLQYAGGVIGCFAVATNYVIDEI